MLISNFICKNRRERCGFKYKIHCFVIIYVVTCVGLCADSADSPLKYTKTDMMPSIEGAPIKYSGESIIGDGAPVEVQNNVHSSNSFYISSQGPTIIIDKNIKGLEEKYYKNDNITIRLKILNADRQNRLESIYLTEEIPSDFELIDVKPGNVELKETDDLKTITWNFEKNLSDKENLEYTVRTNKSGKYIFSSTILDAKAKDRNGRTYEILQSSGDCVFITINNRDPDFGPVVGLEKRCKIGKDMVINISVVDPDLDSIKLKLKNESNDIVSDSTNGIYIPNLGREETYSYHTLTLNTSDYKSKPGIYRFTIEATDGETKIWFYPEIDMYKIVPRRWIPSIDTIWDIVFSLISALVGFMIGYCYKRKN